MSDLSGWAAKWRIPPEALAELAGQWHTDPNSTATGSEASVVAERRKLASRRGGRAWRNNVGAYQDDRGNWVRYGLCNESAQMNKRVKSSDLIGVEPILITQDMVGTVVGRFFAEECKRPGWAYTGNEHERAQLNFINLVNSLGGRAEFVTK